MVVISQQRGETALPSDIKKAALALALSCISTLIAVYFDGFEIDRLSFDNPFVLGMNIIWTFVIAWLIWDLYKGKDIKLTLVLVSAVMLVSLIYDYIDLGLGIAQVFYAIELLMFCLAFLLINSKESRAWYSSKVDL